MNLLIILSFVVNLNYLKAEEASVSLFIPDPDDLAKATKLCEELVSKVVDEDKDYSKYFDSIFSMFNKESNDLFYLLYVTNVDSSCQGMNTYTYFKSKEKNLHLLSYTFDKVMPVLLRGNELDKIKEIHAKGLVSYCPSFYKIRETVNQEVSDIVKNNKSISASLDYVLENMYEIYFLDIDFETEAQLNVFLNIFAKYLRKYFNENQIAEFKSITIKAINKREVILGNSNFAYQYTSLINYFYPEMDDVIDYIAYINNKESVTKTNTSSYSKEDFCGTLKADYQTAFNIIQGSVSNFFVNDAYYCEGKKPYEYARSLQGVEDLSVRSNIRSFLYSINGAFLYDAITKPNINNVNYYIRNNYFDYDVFKNIIRSYLHKEALLNDYQKPEYAHFVSKNKQILENPNSLLFKNYDENVFKIIRDEFLKKHNTCWVNLFGVLNKDNVAKVKEGGLFNPLIFECEDYASLNNRINDFGKAISKIENTKSAKPIVVPAVVPIILTPKDSSPSETTIVDENSPSVKATRKKFRDNKKELRKMPDATDEFGDLTKEAREARKIMRKTTRDKVQGIKLEALNKEMEVLRKRNEELIKVVNGQGTPAEKRKAQKEIEMNQFKLSDKARRYKNLEQRNTNFNERNCTWILEQQ